jgi:hypothetical protein
LSLILDQLTRVFWFLAFESHCVENTFSILRGTLASRLLGQLGERAGFRNEYVDKLAAHAPSNSSKCTDCDAIVGFSLFELLDRLSGRVHCLADFALAKVKGLAH